MAPASRSLKFLLHHENRVRHVEGELQDIDRVPLRHEENVNLRQG
jgi:hypothetical protein